MNIFILKHPSKEFSGNVYGVNFSKGIGSTSSQRDANFCIQKHGCEDITDKYVLKKDEKNPAAKNYVLKSKKKEKDQNEEKEAPAKKKK